MNRKELKSKALAAFKANYWRCVIVALIAVLLTGLSAGLEYAMGENDAVAARDFDVIVELSLIAFAAWLIKVLVFEPLSLGCKYFFLRNSDEPSEMEEIGRAFTPAWWHNVVTMFLTSLFIFLWTLLLVIPGLVKAYSYRLAPYIQAENPNMRSTEVIKRSRQLMDGHKWEALGLDLSFIGWYLLTAIVALLLSYVCLLAGFPDEASIGVASVVSTVLWLGPYRFATDAELYKALRDGAQTQKPDVLPSEVDPSL